MLCATMINDQVELIKVEELINKEDLLTFDEMLEEMCCYDCGVSHYTIVKDGIMVLDEENEDIRHIEFRV